MKSKKLISAILAAASIAGGVVGAQAQTIDVLDHKVDTVINKLQDQENKIQGLENKVNSIDTTRQVEAEATARKDADQKLQVNINAEATARKDADTKLQKQIDKNGFKADAALKVAGNGAMQNGATNLTDGVNQNTRQVEAEATARKDADQKLQVNINAEATARKDADTKLQKQIDKNGFKADAALKVAGNGAMQNGATNLTDGVNQNTRLVEAEATARKDADTKLQTQIDTNKQQISQNQQNIGKNSSAIKTLQDNWKDSERAFNAEQVQQIDRNKANIELIHDRMDMGAYKDGTFITNGDSIGEALKKLDTNAVDQQKQIDKNGFKADAALKVIGNGAMQNGATNLTDGVNQNTRLVEAEAKARDNAVKAEAKVRDDADQKLQANIDAEATARKDADTKLQKQIDKNGIKADTALKVIGNGAMQNGATNLTDGVNQNTRLVEAEAKARDNAVKAEAKVRDDADQKLQANIDAEATARKDAVNALNSRIDQVGSDATKGIAKASALAALHPLDYDPDNKFDIAAAGGFYKGENAFALGAFYRPNRNVMLSMGTTLTSGDNAYNVGLTFKIGKSGKHTEAGLTTADLYAMIGAMQDKMDQQQKKIEELEAKQAK